jgi:hypothetical protein
VDQADDELIQSSGWLMPSAEHVEVPSSVEAERQRFHRQDP